ncbi:ROK family protein [Methylocella sp.]|uniref:ROK family protein n=1 Tax=Methylocella sp. TaxID=1978226 RepID=UPI0035B00868
MRIGVDLGGTKIEAIALDERGVELVRRRVRTPAGDYRGTIETVAALVAGVEAQIGAPATVGVATPGALSRATGRMKNANSTVLIGEPLDRDLSAALGRPARIANDANCFALSEATDGAGVGAEVVFGVILGTGVGGGLAVGGRIVEGRNAIAGEWGHNPLPWPTDAERPGPACYCGRRGCVETFLAGPSLSRDHFEATGARLSAAQIAAASPADAAARDTLARYRDRLARGLATIVNIVDPDVIVLGGGVSNIEALYDGLTDLIARYAFTDALATQVRKAAHGDSSGVRGAAWLWPA